MKTSVVIVNWNGLAHLQLCLPSVVTTVQQPAHVIVVDNGSTDGSCAYVRAEFPKVTLLSLSKNLGFCGGNNVGMGHALRHGADAVALLNNDTRVEPDWLDALVEVAGSASDIAICQARQRTWDGQREIRFRFLPEWCEAQPEQVPVLPPGPPAPTPFAGGCALLIRSDALRHIGPFDERYFMYVEDVDLSLRAWIAGYRVMDVPHAVVYHRTTGSDSSAERRMFWGYRNQLTTLLKLYQPQTLRHFAGPICRRWFYTRNRLALRGTLAAFAMLPGTLSRRRRIQRSRRQPDEFFLRLCVP